MKIKNYSLFFSIIALAISIITIALFFIKVSDDSVVGLGTFIGICTGFISLFVTIIIGYQIYNSIELRDYIKEFQQRKKELNDLIVKYKNQNKKIELSRYKASVVAHSNIIIKNEAYSLRYQLKVVEISIDLENENICDELLDLYALIDCISHNCFKQNEIKYSGIKVCSAECDKLSFNDFKDEIERTVLSIDEVLKSSKLRVERKVFELIKEVLNVKLEQLNIFFNTKEKEMSDEVFNKKYDENWRKLEEICG